jgi:6-phosphogluconolactonase
MNSAPGAGPNVHAVADAAALAAEVARLVATAVRQGIERRGRATLVLSGGSTPEIYLPRVAELDLPWERVSITLTDERWVDETSPHSNAAAIRRLLLAHPGPSRARFIALQNPAATARAGIVAARAALPPADVPYDLVLLGMGGDGHFASIFPFAPRTASLLALHNEERLAAVPAPATALPAVERITMTLAELRRSERLVLVIQSADKRRALADAYAAGDPLAKPVVALGNVDVLWSP